MRKKNSKRMFVALVAICSAFTFVGSAFAYPKVAPNSVCDFSFCMAKFSTAFTASTKERSHNIARALSFVDGMILFPKEEFSFNKTVGRRTEERGFLESTVIFQGKYVPGIGGGVCQASTTIYNAALLAGLRITEVHNHSLPSSYVLPSFDAMVSDYFFDLRFVNPFSFPVRIEAKTENRCATVAIYGKDLGVTIERISIIKEKMPALSEEEVEDETGEFAKTPDERVLVRPSKEGFVSEGWLLYRKGEEELLRVHIRTDRYQPERGLIYIGKTSQTEKEKASLQTSDAFSLLYFSSSRRFK